MGGRSHDSFKVASALNVNVMEIQTSVAPSEIWLRDDLENIYALLFRFLRYGFRLAMSNVGWLTTQKFVILDSSTLVLRQLLSHSCTQQHRTQTARNIELLAGASSIGTR